MQYSMLWDLWRVCILACPVICLDDVKYQDDDDDDQDDDDDDDDVDDDDVESGSLRQFTCHGLFLEILWGQRVASLWLVIIAHHHL